MLWETYPSDWKNWIPNMAAKTPTITVVDETWQREKCAVLGLTYEENCKQPDQLIGEQLYKYQPWETKLFWVMGTVYSGVYHNYRKSIQPPETS